MCVGASLFPPPPSFLHASHMNDMTCTSPLTLLALLVDLGEELVRALVNVTDEEVSQSGRLDERERLDP
jgi:hypothetical protein